jgi:hypothetical protein
MKHVLSFLLLALGLTSVASAGPFTIHVSPKAQTATGKTSTFTITATVDPAFTATIYLKATAPDLSGTLALSADKIDRPYSASVQATVTLNNDRDGATHLIIVEGANGPTVSRDTVELTVGGTNTWRVYNGTNSPIDTGGNAWYRVLIDAQGRGWLWNQAFYSWPKPGVLSFDSEGWNAYDSTPSGAKIWCLAAADSSGGVWMTTWSGLARWKDGAWTEYYYNSTPGLTRDIVETFFTLQYAAIDARGVLWLSAMTSNGSAFGTFDGTTWRPVDLPPGRVAGQMGIVADRAGNVWIGATSSDGKKSYLLQFDGTYWHEYTVTPGSYTQPVAVSPDGSGVWFLDSPGIGNILMFAPATEQVTPVLGEFGTDATSMTFSDGGDLWVGHRYGWPRPADAYGIARLSPDDPPRAWRYSASNSGLPSNDILDMAYNRVTKTIWAVTISSGLAILDASAPGDSGFVAAVSTPTEGKTARLITQIAPNPASGGAMLDIALPSAGRVSARIVDELGNERGVVVDRMLEAGEHHLPVSTSDLPAGTYFLRVAAGSIVQTGRLVIAH